MVYLKDGVDVLGIISLGTVAFFRGNETLEKAMRLNLLIILTTIIWFSSSSLANELVLGGSKNLSLLPMIAEQQGFYSEEGVNVRHEVITVGKLAMDAVLSGTVDVGVIVDTNLSFISFRENDLKVLATILRHSTDGMVECDQDLELDRLGIRGKRIGYFPATTSHIFLVRWLEKHQLSMDDIEPVILQPTAMSQALKSGAVDAVSIWNPWRAKIKQQFGELCDESVGSAELYPSYAYLAVRKSTLSEKKAQLTAFLRALIKADRFVSANEQRAVDAYAKFANMDEASTESVWRYSEPHVRLSSSALNIVGETIDWLSDNEPRFRRKKSRDHADFFAPELLKSISPERVSINR